MKSIFRLLVPILLMSTAHGTASSVSKDPTAIAVLAQMATATGWSASSVPTDAVATGSVSRATSQDSVNLTYKVRGSAQFRAERQTSSSLSTTIINNGQGAVILPDGTVRFIDPQEAFSFWPVLLPFFSSLSSATTKADISLSYLGTEIVNSVTCQKVQITSQANPSDPLATVKLLTSTITLWVDAKTGLPPQVQYTRTASDNPTATLVYIRQFSNFQQVSGLMVPFTQQEFVNGRLVTTEQIANLSFNVGLTDADFTLPTE